MKTIETSPLPASVLVKHQVKTYGPKRMANGDVIVAKVGHDDDCGNGHNTFSMTADIYGPDRIPGETTIEFDGRTYWSHSGGCCHDAIAEAFPELAPFIKWHLTSTDGPMHYPGNVLYHAGDRDCWGLRKGEFRQHTSRGEHQNGGVAGVPNWVLDVPDRDKRDVYANEKPAPVVCDWKPYGRTGEGKEREFDSARHCAVWPEATDEQLSLPPDELKALLLDRLPGLMAEFKAAVESLGFTY